MERLPKPISIGTVFVLVALIVGAPASLPATAQEVAPPNAASVNTPAAAASLHNPGFDNGDWYEFDLRYQLAYPSGAWLPDDDNNVANNIPENVRQDWRLWFLDGRDIVETDPEKVYVHSPIEAVQIRTYGERSHLAGIYQVIYNATPCLTYGFQMYAQSRPEGSGDSLTALQVGIDRVGWHPNSATDPAVHGSFPSTTVWGPAHNEYIWYYGPLTVTAEALGTTIAVFTYADANGGRSHRILWDSGSFWETTPGLIPDPDNPPVAAIGSVTVITSATSATLIWTTPVAALGQVYYRLISGPSTPISPTAPYSYSIYLPLINRSPAPWSWTALNKVPATEHFEAISDLQRGSTYEYIVASRGPVGEQCVTWVSERRTFTTAP